MSNPAAPAQSQADPWLNDRRWHNGRVHDSLIPQIISLWILSILTATAAAFFIKTALHHHAAWLSVPVLLATLSTAATAIFLTSATLRTAHWLRFGTSLFQMATFPGIIGRQLVGIVYTKVKLHPSHGFDLSLTCTKSVITGYGKNRSTTQTILWHEHQHLVRGALEQDNTLTAIPVAFRIPHTCQPTFSDPTYWTISWKLDVRAALPGLNYHTSFEVPVFITPESNSPSPIDLAAPYRAKT
ncbi:MAG: hypothetical protein ACTHN5_18990 [Phycisphaerae bacterium]